MGVNGIYGLSGSGLDIESMVKVGMMGKQNEYDKMAQKYTKNEWMKTAYIDISNSISSFNLTKLSDYKMSASMSAKTATSSSDAVKATASGSAEFRSHSVEVTNLVSNAALVGTNKMTRYGITSDDGTANQSSIKLADVLFNDLTKESGKVYGHIANVDMADNSRDYTGSAISDGSKPRTAYTFGRKDETVNSFTDATWNAARSRLETGEFYTTSITWATTDSSVQSDGSGGWKTYNSGTSTWEAVTPDFSTAKWNTANNRFETDEGFYTTNITWDTNGTTWTNKGNNVFTREVVGDVTTGDEAFAFTIGDGKKSVDISYTYNQLLGLNGETAVTFYDLVDKINNAGLNIKASYDADYDRFSFYNTENGSGNNIELTFESMGSKTNARENLVARNFFDNMGLYQSVNGKLVGQDKTVDATENDKNYLLFTLGSTANKIEGQDATIKIDGLSYTSSDNKITKDGITYEAVNETSGIARVSVSQDVDAIVDKVKSFVEDYNKLLSSLYEKYDEKPDSNYKPLTQSQKDAMKEEQITKWEEKAKKGILYHDQTLGKIIQNMRNAVSNQIELSDGKTMSAYSVGISTVAGNIKGQLTLDEDKLRAALSEDPDSVYKVFASLDANDNTNTEKMGIAQRLGDVFTAATKSIRTRAGSSTDVTEDSDLNNLLRQLQTKMSNFKKMMDAFEDKLYKKYDTMESTLAKLGTQLNFISGVGQG